MMGELERRQLADQIKTLKGDLERKTFNFDTGMDQFHYNTTNEGAILNAIGFLRDYQSKILEVLEKMLKEVAKQ